MTLQDICDRLEIEDVLTRYATALDAKDWETWEACFTPDAYIDYSSSGGIKGPLPEVKQWVAQIMPIFPMTQHLVMNKVITIQGDTATARTALFNPMGVSDGKGGLSLFFEGGYYRDKFVRTPQGWRIAERVEESAYSTRRNEILPPGSLG